MFVCRSRTTRPSFAYSARCPQTQSAPRTTRSRGVVRGSVAGRQRSELDPDLAGEGLERDPAALWSIAAVVRQDVAARRD
jgi:hypothetical protein